MLKHELIALVRAAQRERDPVKQAQLWDLIREAGLPHDATVAEEKDCGKPSREVE